MALHLDATFAEYNTWKEFASCFLKLSQCEEDRMSICLGGSNGELLRGSSNLFNRNDGIFALGVLGKEWRFRCRWWLSRHFRVSMLLSEIAAGIFHFLCHPFCVLYGSLHKTTISTRCLLFYYLHNQITNGCAIADCFSLSACSHFIK